MGVRLTNENSRIDLNTAEDNLVSAVLQSLGMSASEASERIRNLRRYQGINISDSSDNGESLDAENIGVAANTPLISVGELARVTGWSFPPTMKCLRNAFTAYTQSHGFDVSAVDPAFKKALMSASLNPGQSIQRKASESTLPSSTTQQSAIGDVLRINAVAPINKGCRGLQNGSAA